MFFENKKKEEKKKFTNQNIDIGSQKVVKPLGPLAEREKLAESMARAGWPETKMRKVLGENWLNYLEKIFEA